MHPIFLAKFLLQSALERFQADGVPRSVAADLLGSRSVILCGANANGKSTYLRSAAQLVVLAQTGSFVPATYARLSVCDRLFARVGASDDVTRSRSTFLLEMEETAAILRGVTPSSLVLIDEVGRGTAMADGLAIACAVAEHLTEVGCRVLFATHIHELTALALAPRHHGEPRVRCMAMDVLPGPVPVLTHRVILHPIHSLGKEAQDTLLGGRGAGPSASAVESPDAAASLQAWKRILGMSHGLHVAAIAGLPTPVVQRARTILEALDETHAAAAWARAVAAATCSSATDVAGHRK
jgi:DNA mismatch repair ATPase MutS